MPKDQPRNFSRALLTWYRKNARDLPWRETRDPYKIWISEVMLQQTTVKAVIPYYHKWIKRFPDPRALARARRQTVLNAWQGLGYYARAHNLHRAARIFVEEFGGKIPSSADALRAVPGFGPYTMGAVLSIAFNQDQMIVDANVRRVVQRLLAQEIPVGSKGDQKIHDYLGPRRAPRNMATFNQALMELGALVCRSQEPLCGICPLRAHCRAYAKGVQEIIPAKRKTSLKAVDAVIAVIEHKGKYFIQQRPSLGLFAGLWEFPGGKIEKRESPRRALKREVREELGAEVGQAEYLTSFTHYYTQFKATLRVWSCTVKPLPATGPSRRWASLRQLNSFPMPSGSARIVEYLQKNGN